MVDIDSLLKEYKAYIKYKKMQKSMPEKEEDQAPAPGLWPSDFLPPTKYTADQSKTNLDKIERISKKDPMLIGNKKLVRILTSIDISLIRSISAEDLVLFDGTSESLPISHIQNKNKALKVWLVKEFDLDRLFKMLKYSLAVKNYNLINILASCVQSNRLSKNKLNRVKYYKSFLEKQEGGIFPFEWMLKDCEDSNLNVDSEVASMRFCRIVEKLKEMKGIKDEFVLKERHKQLVFAKLWNVSNQVPVQSEPQAISDENLYLVL